MRGIESDVIDSVESVMHLAELAGSGGPGNGSTGSGIPCPAVKHGSPSPSLAHLGAAAPPSSSSSSSSYPTPAALATHPASSAAAVPDAAADAAARRFGERESFPRDRALLALGGNETAYSEAATRVVRRGADDGLTAIDVRDADGRTPLFLCAHAGWAEAAEVLLAAGAHADAPDGVFGATPLVVAAQEGRDAVVRCLLRGGRADPLVLESRHGASALLLAAQNGHEGCVEAIMEVLEVPGRAEDGSAEVSAAGGGKGAAAGEDVGGGSRRSVAYMREHVFYPAMLRAAHHGHAWCLRRIVIGGLESGRYDTGAAHRCAAGTEGRSGRDCLSVAAHRGHTAAVRELLALGADPTATVDGLRKTPVHHACEHGNVPMLEMLLAGAPAVCLSHFKAAARSGSAGCLDVLYDAHIAAAAAAATEEKTDSARNSNIDDDKTRKRKLAHLLCDAAAGAAAAAAPATSEPGGVCRRRSVTCRKSCVLLAAEGGHFDVVRTYYLDGVADGYVERELGAEVCCATGTTLLMLAARHGCLATLEALLALDGPCAALAEDARGCCALDYAAGGPSPAGGAARRPAALALLAARVGAEPACKRRVPQLLRQVVEPLPAAAAPASAPAPTPVASPPTAVQPAKAPSLQSSPELSPAGSSMVSGGAASDDKAASDASAEAEPEALQRALRALLAAWDGAGDAEGGANGGSVIAAVSRCSGRTEDALRAEWWALAKTLVERQAFGAGPAAAAAAAARTAWLLPRALAELRGATASFQDLADRAALLFRLVRATTTSDGGAEARARCVAVLREVLKSGAAHEPSLFDACARDESCPSHEPLLHAAVLPIEFTSADGGGGGDGGGGCSDRCNLEVLSLLLDSGADATAVDSAGRTALFRAVRPGASGPDGGDDDAVTMPDLDGVRMLLEKGGADATACDDAGVDLLDLAAEHRLFELARFLLDRHRKHFVFVAAERHRARRLREPLHFAAQGNDAAMVLLLLDRGFPPHVRGGEGRHTPLGVAVYASHPHVVKVLLEHHPAAPLPPPAAQHADAAAGIAAAAAGVGSDGDDDEDVVAAAASATSPSPSPSPEEEEAEVAGETPGGSGGHDVPYLQFAAQVGDLETMRLLVERWGLAACVATGGADPAVHEYAAFSAAVRNGHVEAARFLKGAGCAVRPPKGDTSPASRHHRPHHGHHGHGVAAAAQEEALLMAGETDQVDVLDLLIRECGYTPTFAAVATAVESGSAAAARYLLLNEAFEVAPPSDVQSDDTTLNLAVAQNMESLVAPLMRGKTLAGFRRRHGGGVVGTSIDTFLTDVADVAKPSTPFHHAAHYGRAGMLRTMIEACQANAAAPRLKVLEEITTIMRAKVGKLGDSCLHLAVKGGHLDVVRLVMSHGCEVFSHEKKVKGLAGARHEGLNSLQLAVRYGRLAILKDMFTHAKISNSPASIKAALNERIGKAHSHTCLEEAALYGHPSIAALLVQNGCSGKAPPMPLYVACHAGHARVVSVLLRHAGAGTAAAARALVNELVPYTPGHTAVFAAAAGGHVQVAKLLLAHGANLAQRDTKHRATPLHAAAEGGHHHVVRAMCRGGAACGLDINARDGRRGHTALFAAVCNGRLDATRVLLEEGARVNDTEGSGHFCPVFASVTEGHTAMLRLLLQHGAAVDTREPKYEATPLYIAAQRGDADAVLCLIAAGADVDHRTVDRGHSPTFAAALSAHALPLSLLPHATARHGAEAARGSTPLHIAAQNGHAGVVALLLQAGACATAALRSGVTPLQLAVTHGHPACERLLKSV